MRLLFIQASHDVQTREAPKITPRTITYRRKLCTAGERDTLSSVAVCSGIRFTRPRSNDPALRFQSNWVQNELLPPA